MPKPLLHLGRIKRAHGIKGELELDWAGEYVPKAGDPIFIGDLDNPKELQVVKVRRHNGRLLLLLKQVDNRNDAENLIGKYVFLPRCELPPLEEDETFLADLPGCRVLLPGGEEIGILDHLEFPAGKTVWAINSAKGHEILFPAVDDFIKAIDLKKNEIVIDPPAGLLDIYNA